MIIRRLEAFPRHLRPEKWETLHPQEMVSAGVSGAAQALRLA